MLSMIISIDSIEFLSVIRLPLLGVLIAFRSVDDENYCVMVDLIL